MSRSCCISCGCCARHGGVSAWCSASATSASRSRPSWATAPRSDPEFAYVYDGPELDGTAGAIRGALPLLGDAFLVLYGDTYLRLDYADVDARSSARGRRR